ncbi:MAG: 3-hydroxyacyl-CoA dehydrogenase NAD-binding domain-containing protein [Chitinophagales bacterium]
MERQDFVSIDIADNGVATVWLDQKDEKVNKISPEVIELFDGIISDLKNDAKVKAIVLISKKKDFIAGADIDAFKQVKKPGDFEPITRQGHRILQEMEDSKKPIVAAIHGSCLGAGLEITLACTARMASDDKSTKMALPEVQLGLLPGGGGTQRLPRLVGIQKALDMMLTGKNIFAKPAKRMGLVDRLIHKEALHRAACEFALELCKKPIKRKDSRKLPEKLLESNPITRNIIYKKAGEMVMKQTQGNYPAPFKILECVKTGMEKGRKAGFDAEAKLFEELILTPESRQLINIFFGMTEKKKNPWEGARQVNTLAMLGAGFMGEGIAEVSANKDIKVLLKDLKMEGIATAKANIWKSMEQKVRKKIMSKPEADAVVDRIHGQTDYSNFERADIVIEAVFEDINLKRKILAETESATREDCIFASNTSALPIASIAKEAKRPELVVGMHYFSPVPKMPLLEIIRYEKTADWVVATAYELGKRQGKTCIVVNDGPGFYTTRILATMFNECLLVLEEGADALFVDRALKKFGYPVGPVTLIDEVGIDVGAKIMKGELIEHYKQRPGAKTSDVLIKMNDAGYSGRKNKKGFYQYDENGKKKSGEINPEMYQFFGGTERKKFDETEVQLRLGFAMVNEALICLEEGIISSPLDGDIGAVFGLGFPPFRGGPFRYVDALNPRKAVEILNDLKSKYGERFKPADVLAKKAAAGKLFYGE